MRLLRCCLLALVLLAIAAPAFAFVPQTVVFTGHATDFDPGNLLRDDSNDTQPGCSPPVNPLDIGRVFLTNDNNYLYIGIEMQQSCYCNMNLGVAINTSGTTGGGTTDPFGRKIGWANISTKPNWMIYDVTPTSCNTFNYEVLYKDSLGTWLNKSTSVNPSWGSGSNGLGIIDSVLFKEIRLPLSVLGVTTGNAMNFEVWITQEGATKGPLDAMCSNDVQMSHPNVTSFDTTAVVQMTCMLPFTVLNAVDNQPPTVGGADAVNFPLLGNKNFVLSTNKVDVSFSEPVDLTTAQTTGNYGFTGPVTRTIVSAIRDAAALNVVHLTLNSAVSANAAFYNITVTGVKDIAGNTIVANGSTNVGSFFVQTVKFTGDMHMPLCNGTFAPTDTFTVEGSLPPLTFALCDDAFLVANGDSTYSVTVPFAMEKDRVSGKATASLEWKLVHQCRDYEGIAGNRTYTLSSDNGASVNLTAAWSDNNPVDFITHDVDVIFKVDASRKNPLGTDVITLLGDQLPLSFTQPGVPMLDNGVYPDAVAGDKVYTAKVRFKKCTYRNIGWKVDFDGAYECPGQGNRTFTIDEASVDTVGGTHGPLTLPARGIDRCDVTDKAVAVQFRVDMFPSGPPVPTDTVTVNGDYAPLAFAWPPAALYAGLMADNGVAPDAKAGDYIYTRLVTFPDSTKLNMTYKYVRNGIYECNTIANRPLFLDDTQYSVANPLLHVLDRWDYCSTLGVEPITGPGLTRLGSSADFATLLQSFPNPGFARSTIRFELKRAGRVTLTVYDIAGRRVARLMDGSMAPGVHETTWNGLDASGKRVQAGLYLYELAMGGERLTRRLILSK